MKDIDHKPCWHIRGHQILAYSPSTNKWFTPDVWLSHAVFVCKLCGHSADNLLCFQRTTVVRCPSRPSNNDYDIYGKKDICVVLKVSAVERENWPVWKRIYFIKTVIPTNSPKVKIEGTNLNTMEIEDISGKIERLATEWEISRTIQ